MGMRITETTIRRLIREVFIGSDPTEQSTTPQVLRRTEPVAKTAQSTTTPAAGREEFDSSGYKYAWIPEKEQFLVLAGPNNKVRNPATVIEKTNKYFDGIKRQYDLFKTRSAKRANAKGKNYPAHMVDVAEEKQDQKPLNASSWISAISQVESGGKYDKMNSQSFALGKYQFLPGIWWNNALISKRISGDLLNKYTVSGITEFAKEQGKTLPKLLNKFLSAYTPDEQQRIFSSFLKDPTLQDGYMEHYVENFLMPHVKALRAEEPNAAYLSDSSLMSLLHFQGPKGARDWLKSGRASASEQDKSVANASPAIYIEKVQSYLA